MKTPGDNSLVMDLWLTTHIDEIRRSAEQQTRDALLTLIELDDSLAKMCGDESFEQLPHGWKDALLILRQKVKQSLSEKEVQPITAVGQRLDPRLHHVVQTRHGPEQAEIILAEQRTGYFWRDQLLRPAEVITSTGPESPNDGQASREQA